MPYTAEQVASAIAEPRVGDVWEKGGKQRKITRVVPGYVLGSTDLYYVSNSRTGAIFQYNFSRWARTATLVHRAGEVA